MFRITSQVICYYGSVIRNGRLCCASCIGLSDVTSVVGTS